MTKPEWGTKRQCPKCGTRFYDLTIDDPVVCIECGHSWIPEPVLKSKQALPFAEEKPEDITEDKKGEEDVIDIDDADGEPSDDANVDLGSDEDDISGVVGEKRPDEDE